MRLDNFARKKLIGYLVVLVFLIASAFIIFICVKQLINHNKPVEKKAAEFSTSKKTFDGQVNVWGSYPKDACFAFEEQGLLTYEYKQSKEGNGLYSCASPEVQIPEAKGIKTIQYEAKGFASKVIEYSLTLRLKDDKNKLEDEAARKVWAIYIAVLLNSLFEITLDESELQAIANLEVGKSLSAPYKNKLRLIVEAKKENGFLIYSFKAFGMPMLGDK